MAVVPSLTFTNGHKIPILGLGTWKSEPAIVGVAVKDAISTGYRHIDCAWIYGNEQEIGRAIREKIGDKTVKRKDLFITNKLWNTYHNPSMVEKACRTSLDSMGLDYFDLYMMHYPFGFVDSDGVVYVPKDDRGKIIFSDVDYIDTWKGMETLVDKGLVRSIGVSNFNSYQIHRLMTRVDRKHDPVCCQIESSPYFPNEKLIHSCKSKGLVVTTFSPLGSPDRPWAKPKDPKLLHETTLLEIGTRYKKTPAQIALRWNIERGCTVIPKSVTPNRLRENIDIFNFSLSGSEIKKINMLDRNLRVNTFSSASKSPYYPFHDEY
ncbi:hypothetical protein KUTeg_005557 [Tegillarca granosa]|uniref:NADP-dependent oxidoreductase domain-containing protein n=1 Tax=Tegillarca granosa TaxID=220873 RepID=A0ABQ9FPL9_TEGGR|nr:hypothetical protein KUTeg_005557 [Tegillarca granosa]